MKKQFLEAGYTVVDTDSSENKLLAFLKEHYPNVIKDNEIDLNELKAIAGLPIDEKVNGYGLNFVGRNFARAKYSQDTDKELRLNKAMSRDIETTQNLVLKGDNLDSLKILKNYYNGMIKCIYIDPPYNTDKDEFIYPDKFDKEEAEVLGLANLSNDDFARMDFSFKTKKSHNGWLSFMYPRLLLARDLLSNDGVIFISIDDNEQANLKLLCDDVFGEENFVATIIWERAFSPKNDAKYYSENHDYILVYGKSIQSFKPGRLDRTVEANSRYSNPDKDLRGDWLSDNLTVKTYSEKYDYSITTPSGRVVNPANGSCWRISEQKFQELVADNRIWFGEDGSNVPRLKRFLSEVQDGMVPTTFWRHQDAGHNQEGRQEVKKLFDDHGVFDGPKPVKLLNRILEVANVGFDDIVLDFFAGSGTTGHAVMELNKDGGNRKFILCQIDEPIEEDKPAYQFCLNNNLQPVISSITIERLRRAGDKVVNEIEAENGDVSFLDDLKKDIPDTGFKVFDSADAPKLELKDGEIIFPELFGDTISRIYNMIFTVGLDEPTQVPEEVVKDSIFRIGNNYYITNSDKISPEDFADAIKNGKVFIDGWTASLNSTLQHYKDDVKIVF